MSIWQASGRCSMKDEGATYFMANESIGTMRWCVIPDEDTAIHTT